MEEGKVTVLSGFKKRWEKVRLIHRRHNVFYEMLGAAAILLVFIKIGEHIIFETENGFHLNLFTDGVALAATIFMVDRFYRYRDKSSLQNRLVGEASSRSHDIAISAVEWMEREGWLRGEDGLLKGANLREARLWDARMDGANLEGAILDRAVLCKAKLKCADLRSACLKFAKLHDTKLNKADLQNAKCHGVELPDARLDGACLEDADLSYACLEGASLQGASFRGTDLHKAKLKGAILWDADFYDADLRFTELREAEYHKEASWEDAIFRCTDLNGVDFSDTNMKGADLECADLQDADLSGTNLQNTNLMGALLKGVQFRIFDGMKYAYAGDTPPDFNELPDEDISHKTNWLGATLPDGTVFTTEMDYKDILRFTSPSDMRFPATLARVEAYRNRP